MKGVKIVYAGVFLSILLCFPAFAGNTQNEKKPEPWIRHLQQQLSLSEDQAAKIQIIASSFPAPGPLPSSPRDKQTYLEQRRLLTTQMNDRISLILTDAQRQQFQSLQQKR